MATVKPPLMPPLYKGHFFGGQSIHSLLFQPLYTGHLSTKPLSSTPKVAVVERVNCIKFLKLPFYVHQEDMS